MAQRTVQTSEIGTRAGFGWKRLSLLAAGVGFASHLAIGATYRDLDAVWVAASFAIGFGVTRVRRGTLGFVLLGLAFANVAFWTVPATATNLAGRVGFAAIVVPGAMAVLALTGLLATVGTLTARGSEVVRAGVAVRVLAAAGVCVLVLLGTAALFDRGTVGPEEGDIVLGSDGTAFSETELVASAGTIGVYLENHDYFWHTFTITELGVDLRVPVGASGRVTFEAAPGTYEFVCAIPGHDIAGMVGTLTVVGGRGR